jgi:phage terminase large subunit-like protein
VIRAEPISALYEQGRVHHVGNEFKELEDQMCEFSIDNIRNENTGSPDRVDALVWGLTELFEKIAGRARRSRSSSVEEVTTTYTDWKSDGVPRGPDTSWMGM